jgi:hypothetical protein
MLRLLLDEHISPRVVAGLRRLDASLVVHAMKEWEDGAFPGRADAECLVEAAHQDLTLVTYDRRTIPVILKAWADEGRGHGGVIFVDEKTIAPSDVGGLVRALRVLIRRMGSLDWRDRAVFLSRAQ